mmetsp:Transcript_30917/g.72484  ORF Transcript_30917/g.72484 Transcript_30917/m.72484 type:complete len:215 (+) Transcript_30917:371-1015(+)
MCRHCSIMISIKPAKDALDHIAFSTRKSGPKFFTEGSNIFPSCFVGGQDGVAAKYSDDLIRRLLLICVGETIHFAQEISGIISFQSCQARLDKEALVFGYLLALRLHNPYVRISTTIAAARSCVVYNLPMAAKSVHIASAPAHEARVTFQGDLADCIATIVSSICKVRFHAAVAGVTHNDGQSFMRYNSWTVAMRRVANYDATDAMVLKMLHKV